MTGVAELGVGGWAGALRLLAGAALLAAPGLAAADRFIGLRRNGWMFAPVFSLTLLPLTAILLDFLLQVPVTAPLTAFYAALWTALLQWHRRHQAAAAIRRWTKDRGLRWPAWHVDRAAGLRLGAWAVVLSGVAAVHALPHVPGEGASAWTAYPRLAERLATGLAGEDYPFPVHVDEHYHLAHQAAIDRAGRIDIDDPYTGRPFATPLFSVQGFRDERGFDLALVQTAHLTGLSFSAQARIAPAAEAAILAGVLYAALWPAPGALASAALVAIVPTTVRFLGPGFLVPSAFALPWIVTALHVSLRSGGGRRLAALALLETGAFFLHLVIGTLVLATAVVASLARPGRLSDRVALASVSFVPLLWIGPLVASDVATAVAAENTLPLQPSILGSAGVLVMAAALVGAARAVTSPDPALRPHVVFTALGLAVLTSLLLSIKTGHHSDATYSRLVPTFFVCIAALAGLALGWGAMAFRRWSRSTPAAFGALAAATLILAAPAVAGHLDRPYYRIFDDASWHDLAVLEAHATSFPVDGVLLCDPWLAPLYNAATGLKVHTVLLPGSVPERAEDWTTYLRTGGSEAWLAERGIAVVVGPAPNATHEHLGGNVYRVLV